ncbi:MAG: polysaccharide biosynthesis C-terminal domain-containing protein [Saprospiraceae bacterium]|nr:polysaccharide biosynthesis C-terminal domain-containing protein [Saprospiraceae bacterium]
MGHSMMSSGKKQSIEASVIQILAAGIGTLSTLFLYPKDLELYGIYGYLTNTASLIVIFVTLGFGNVLLKFYPYYKNQKNHGGFFGFITLGYLTGILLFTLVFCLSYAYFIEKFHSENAIAEFYFLLLPFTLLLVVYEFASQLCINFQKISWTARTAFVLKLILPLVFILTIQDHISRFEFILLIFIYYLISLIWLFSGLYLKAGFLIKWQKHIFFDPGRKELFKFAAFSLMSGTSAMMALRIDSFFVGSMIGAEAAGLFTLAMFMSNVVFIPATAITDVLNPTLAASSKDNDHNALLKLYQTGSLHMMLATFFLSVILLNSFEALHFIMPNTGKIAGMKYALIFLLLARLSDAATGPNHHILAYSQFYRFELYLLIGMAVANIILNYYLIPDWGISGAAFATFISVTTYNILKTLIVFSLLKMQPFTLASLKILALSIVVLLVFQNRFEFENLYLNLAAQIIFSAIAFVSLAFFWKCSPQLNQIILEKLKKFGMNHRY